MPSLATLPYPYGKGIKKKVRKAVLGKVVRQGISKVTRKGVFGGFGSIDS